MRWKWIFGMIGLLIVALVVILYVIMLTFDFNKLKPKIARAALEATGRQLTLGGDFKVAFGFSPSVSVADVDFQNSPWGTRPEMVKVKRLEIQIALLPLIRREIQFKRLVLVGPDILIETDRSGRSNLEFKPAEKPKGEEKKGEEKEGLPPLVFDEIRIERGTVTYHDGKKGKTYSIRIDTLTASLPGGKPTDLSLKGTFNGQPLEVQGTTGPLAGLMAPEKPWPIKVTVKVGGATMSFEGSVREVLKGRGLDLNFNAEGPSIGKVAEFGGVTQIPDVGPFKLSGKINDSAGKLNVTNLQAVLAGSDLAGSLELNLSGKQPQVTADLSSQKLDLTPFFPGKGKKISETQKPAKPAAKKEKIFSNEPLPLEGLKSVDAYIKMKAGRLQIQGLKFENLNTEVRLESGNLGVKPLGFILNGGAIGGFFDLRSQENNSAFTLNMKVNQLDVGSLLKELGAKQVLEGKLDAEVELSGKGQSIAGWMAGLDGRTMIVMGKGRLHNQYLDLLGADLAQNILRLINPLAKGENFTQVNCLVNGFGIKNGLATCTALVLDTNQMRVAGGGDINLKDERLNLSLHPSPKEGFGVGGVGKVSLSLGELTKPFRLGGTLAHPSLAIDTKAALMTIGKVVGGVALLGPAGVLEALASASPNDPNPCLTAIESAKRGGHPEKKAQESQNLPPGLKEGAESIGRELKRLFNK